MFDRLKQRFNTMGTLKSLCERAEHHALQEDQRDPGIEHFLLAAVDLPDGTARRAFARVGADASSLSDAIARQYAESLRAVGIHLQMAGPEAKDLITRPKPGLYNASPSGQELMQRLAANRVQHAPLLGAHVVAEIAAISEGVAARAIRAMGIKPEMLKSAAEAEIAAAA